MKQYIEELRAQLEERLLTIEQDSSSVLQQAEHSFLAIEETLEAIRQYRAGHAFGDREEEIHFFRDQMPPLYAKLIYYVRVYHLETKRPFGCRELERQILTQEKEEIKGFQAASLEFSRYYRSGSHFLDGEYFTESRQPGIKPTVEEFSFLVDTHLITPYGYKLAKLFAYEALEPYIEGALAALDQKTEVAPATELRKLSPPWTASKTALIELAYGLYKSGALGTNSSLNKIMTFFEVIFNTKLGNYSRVFQQMRIRKKERTPFLDKMSEQLKDYMDELDMA